MPIINNKNWNPLLIFGLEVDIEKHPELKLTECPKCNEKCWEIKKQIVDSLLWADKHSPEIFDIKNYKNWSEAEKYALASLILSFFKEYSENIISSSLSKKWEKLNQECLERAINLANILAWKASKKEIKSFWINKVIRLSKERKNLIDNITS